MSADIRDFGASESKSSNTAEIQAAINAVGKRGGIVHVPPGQWRTGTLWLESHVELNIATGARLMGTGEAGDFPYRCAIEEELVESRRVGPRRLIGAWDCENVTISGNGIIDGQGGCPRNTDFKAHEHYPQNLQFVKCRNVRITGVTLRDAGSWMQQIMGCENVHVHGIRVWNHGNHTTDGLDIDGSRDVIISDCHIDSHDDALVFKSTGPLPCRNIVVSNCILRSNCHGIKFGTESVGGFRNIRISNCYVSSSEKPSPIPGFPDGRPVITGCALECTDGGVMQDIDIDGLTVENAFVALFIKLGNRLHRHMGVDKEHPGGQIRGIRIQNVKAHCFGEHTISITGYPLHPLEAIELSNINVAVSGGAKASDVLDEVPENSDGYPEINMFTKKSGKLLPAHGVYARHVNELKLRNVHFTPREKDVRPALVFEDVSQLVEIV